MSADSNIRRLQSLDSLRGVAALIVVFYHMVGALPAPFASLASAPWRPLEGLPGWMVTLRYATAWIPLRLLWGGGYECVLLFFVLSGYVLSLPYLAGKSPSWTRYIGKRLCRLYLPSIAAILFALAMRAIAINGTYTFTPEWPWAAPLTPSLIWNNVLFLGGGDSFHLDGTIWSLVHEMRISIIFPFLFLIVLRTPALLSYATSALLALWAFHFVPTIGADTPLAQAERSWADTSGYVFYFVLGIVAARYHQKIGNLLCGHPARQWALLLASLLLLNDIGNFGAAAARHLGLMRELQGLGAAGLVILAATPGLFRQWLHAPCLLWLGHISFSLYLTHYIILSLLWALFGPVWGVVLTLPLALPVAALFCRWVEVPSKNLGYRYFGQSPQIKAMPPV